MIGAATHFLETAPEHFQQAIADLRAAGDTAECITVSTHPEAHKVLLDKASRGDTFAMVFVGLRHLMGLGAAANESEALAWLRRAGDKGNPIGNSFAAGVLLGTGSLADPVEGLARWLLVAHTRPSLAGVLSHRVQQLATPERWEAAEREASRMGLSRPASGGTIQ